MSVIKDLPRLAMVSQFFGFHLILLVEHLREAPFSGVPPLCGHCPFGGGGLNPCPDGLGHFFREEFSKFKWAFASFLGGLNPCQDGLGHLCSEN